MARTLITGGTVISATGSTLADVLIDGTTIAAVLAPGSSASLGVTADDTHDATGKYVIPGGVDAHTHMELPFGGTSASDTFETGTLAAAFGGTTTIIDFPVQRVGERIEDGLAQWHRKAAGQCAIDYGFHMIVGEANAESLKAMDYLVDHEGITSFKMFMAYPGVFYSSDAQLLQAMQVASNNGSMIMMHAENGPAIDVLIAQALGRGETAPYFHTMTRPVEMEEEATHRAIMLAKVAKAPLYIVHMSAKEAVETVSRARGNGANVFGETCPQYLYFSAEDHLAKPGFEGAAYVCSTPLRHRGEGHQAALWKYLRTNDLSVVATDHCPFCMKEQKELGLGDFSKIPNGIGGVEHRMDTIYQGVVDGQITKERWVELCSTTPARMFGLDGRKGDIVPGFDADIVIYDPNATQTLSVETHHMNMDHSAYEGMVINGTVSKVFSRGRLIIDGRSYLGRKGDGEYVKRGLSSYLL